MDPLTQISKNQAYRLTETHMVDLEGFTSEDPSLTLRTKTSLPGGSDYYLKMARLNIYTKA